MVGAGKLTEEKLDLSVLCGQEKRSLLEIRKKSKKKGGRDSWEK